MRLRIVRSVALAAALSALLASCLTATGGARGRRAAGARLESHSAGSGAGPIGSDAGAGSGASAVTRDHRSLRLVNSRLGVPAANRTGFFTKSHTLRLPRGWHAEVWAQVPDARLETWAPDGILLVSDPEQGEIIELTPQRRRAAPSRERVLISGLNQPQGMAFDHVDAHEVLYVAETDEIDRYVWRGDRVDDRRVLIPNLPSGDDHNLKNIVVGANHDLYFDIGSTSNATPPGRSNPPWASVMEYSPSGHRIRVLARGVRNGDGLSFAPDGTLWTAINERDDIAYPFHKAYGRYSDAYGQVIQSYVNNHPPDEIVKLTPGRNVGWPYCNPDPDVHPGAARTGFDYSDMRLDDDAQTNPGGHTLDCARLARINLGLPAHSAPLGFHFLQGSRLPAAWRNGAVVGVHGSWDRDPPRAPGVLWMPWEAQRGTLGRAIRLIGGFQYPNGSRWGRPVDAVPGPDGALYVSDDTADAVYRIVP